MSLFNEENTSPNQDPNGGQNQDPAQSPSVVDQLLAGIKNESGEQKYDSVEKALEGLVHAQDFISTLKTEKEDVAAKLKSQEQLQELLNARPQGEPAAPVEPAVAGLSAEDVLAVIEQREAVASASKNASKVTEAFTQAYGAEAQTTLVAKVEAAGLSKAMADKMAQESPDALLKLLDVKAPAPSATGNGLNTEQFGKSKDPEPYKFISQMTSNNKNLENWRSSVKETNTRLGLN